MNNLKKYLNNKLKNYKRILVFGIGSELKADDSCGLIIADIISKKVKSPKIKAVIASTAPENFTGEIKKFNPSHLIIIDCAQMGKTPGEYAIIEYEDISGISFSTHTLPLKIVINYLNEFVKPEIIIIGIEPKTINFGEKPSKEVLFACEEISKTIISCF